MKKSKIIFIIMFILLISSSVFLKISVSETSLFLEDCCKPVIKTNYYFDNLEVLEDEDITVEEAKNLIIKRFSDYNIVDIEYIGEVYNKFNFYNFKIIFGNDKKICAEVTVKGGHILVIECYPKKIGDFEGIMECEEKVEKFVNNLGFTDVKAVWSTKKDDLTYINLAPIEENVVIYPNMLKATVNCEKGEIIELEARTYTTDLETSKELLKPELSKEEAEKLVDIKCDLLCCRLVLIEKEAGNRVLAYEFKSKIDDYIYYIYVNAKTGEVEEVLQGSKLDKNL